MISEALKIDSTLTELNLRSEIKKKENKEIKEEREKEEKINEIDR